MSPPRPAGDATPFEWVASWIDLWGGPWVTGLAGPGYADYARIFHPSDDAATWADVAAENGKTMHPSAQWAEISSREPYNQQGDHRSSDGPMEGDLDPAILAPLCAVLGRHTGTPDRCYFAVWDGWGWQDGGHLTLSLSSNGEPATPPEPPPASWQLASDAPLVATRGRSYLLYQGAVDDALRIGDWATASWFLPQSPSFMWPADHAWCLATEIDLDSTLVGGSASLVADIVGSAGIDALRIAPDAPRFSDVNQ